MRSSTTTAARPSSSHHTKHCSQRSARCTGQNLYADSASATHATARGGRSPACASRRHVSIMAMARPSSCALGSRTTRSATGTAALTASTPPKLALVVTRGFS
eukprot:963227-Pleurochrysis_carterae.AAC.1